MKNNSKILTIIKHEYFTKIKTKGFIIGTIIAPIGLLLLISIPAAIMYFTMHFDDSDERKLILINDQTGLVGEKIVATDKNNYELSFAPEAELEEQILSNKISAALILDENAIKEGKAKILIGESTGLKFIDKLRVSVHSEIKNLQLQEANIEQTTIDLVNSSVNFETIKVTNKGTVKDNTEILSGLSYALGLIMFALIFTNGGQVMQSVIEEKTNRIIEIMASSVTPFQIMFGKVVGIGAAGLTQVIFWIILGSAVMFGIGIFIGGSSLVDTSMLSNTMNINSVKTNEIVSILENIELPTISLWLIIGFIFYFIIGYFIFATLFAAAGATVDQVQDANSIATPLSLIGMIPIMLIPNIMMSPEGTVAIITSLIPFFTPTLMMSRVVAISVPFWQIALSVVLLIITFLLCLKFAAKIYQIGILSYGKKVGFKEIIKWIRL